MAKATTYNYLHWVSLRNLINWSVAHLLENDLGFSNKYPFVRIGDILYRNTDTITVADDVEYKQVTLKINGGGAVLRGTKVGKDIGTKKQYKISAGQFIMSKIDARNGAFGVVSKELDGAIVTGDFPSFNVDEKKVNPSYLYLLSATQKFVHFAQSCSRGTTNRQRIDIPQFLNVKIPLPSIKEQNKIVAVYNSTLCQAERLYEQAQEIEEQIENYWHEILGVATKQREMQNDGKHLFRFMKLVWFKDVTRWDVYSEEIKYNTTYKVVPLGNLIKRIATGTTPPTSQKEYFKGNIKFFTPSDIIGDMYLGKTERFISQNAINDNKARLFKKGDILFVGIGSTVGKVGIVNDAIVSSNQQITGFTLDANLILPEYVFCFMNYNKTITTKQRSKTTLPIVNQNKIVKIPIPLPPIKKQQEIVNHISILRDKIQTLKNDAINLRKQAITNFETTLFA